jgi:N-acetylneuraminate synthase
VVEVHVIFDRRMFGPDSAASLTIDELAQMVEGIRFVERARGGEPGKALTSDVVRLREIFGRSIAVNRDLPAGHVIAVEDIEGKKPSGMGIPVERFDDVVGRKLGCNKARWDFLREDDLV